MNWSRFAYKSHKWLAVGAGVFTLVWFASGVLLVLPARWFAAPAESADAPPDFRSIRVSVPEAIAAVEAAQGRTVKVTNIRLRALGGRLAYVVTAGGQHHLIDAVSGAPVRIDEAFAREILAATGASAPVREVLLLNRHEFSYPQGELPAFRFILDDPAGTWVHVGVASGEARVTTRRERAYNFLGGTHTFDFLRPYISDSRRRQALLLPSIVGSLMTLFGGWILWIQFVNWREARRRASR